jgi:cysteine sulfinate desulfinase/cysteine desulfurase-like protein
MVIHLILAAAEAARLEQDRMQEEQGMLQRLQEHLLSFVQVAEETVTTITVVNLNVLLLEKFQMQPVA